MNDLPFRSAKQLAALIRARKVGSLELLELYIERAQRLNPSINAIICTDYPGARKRARAADAALKRGKKSQGPLGPLHGVPMTVKESYDVVGMPTTWGFPPWKENRPPRNALAVQRLLDGGAVIFGKTNVPLFLADWQSYNAIYGTTNNPWDVKRTPGGSSGGSAAALAAGLTGLEAGSDIGASIRNPAHYCGVYGHKPTWHAVSPRGQAPPGVLSETDIAVVGPLARSAEDLALALGVMAGPNLEEGVAWQLKLPHPKKKELRQFKVGLLLDAQNAAVDQDVQTLLGRLAGFLRQRKVKVDEQARPDVNLEEAHRLYNRLLLAAMSARQTDDDFRRNLEAARPLDAVASGLDVQRARAMTLSHRDWLLANEARHKMAVKWAEFFQHYDLLLCPVASSAAFPHDHEGEFVQRTIVVNDKRVPATAQVFWAGYSGVVFLPSTAAPIGLTPAGLPVGVQIIGPQFGDYTCIQFAKLLEREYYRFVPPPGFE